MSEVLLLTLHVPHFGAEVDADFVADELVRLINEQREPGTEPVMVNLLPDPQWLDVRAQQMLIKAIQIVNLGMGDEDVRVADSNELNRLRALDAVVREMMDSIGSSGEQAREVSVTTIERVAAALVALDELTGRHKYGGVRQPDSPVTIMDDDTHRPIEG